MPNIGEVTVKVNYEMTDTGKEVLRSAILKILQEPDVLKALLEALRSTDEVNHASHSKDGRRA